jgi:sugar (pentulose or hexulose) kinase
MMEKFNALLKSKNISWKLEDILPKVLNAGADAGNLLQDSISLLDADKSLNAGIPLCPPEGDAGTGMVATNSIKERTGNVSAGTSIFAMVVLEKNLSKVYSEIDMVTTPAGKPVAMAHCNNCTSDLDAWIKLFRETIELAGGNISKPALYDALYDIALKGDSDCGGLLSYNYFGGEPITDLTEGRPLFVRNPDSKFTLANFMRNLLFSSMATLKIGMDILIKQENVSLDQLLGHGGLFKTKEVGQRLMAAAMNVPVAVMDSAAEGGAWGLAALAAYMVRKCKDETLENYLSQKVFAGTSGSKIDPNADDVVGFEAFMKRYVAGLAVEKAAVESLK